MAQGCGTITVEVPFDRSAVGIVGCSGVPATAEPGETVTTTVEIENANEVDVEVTLVISGGGSQFGEATFTVGANRTVAETVGFQIPADARGDVQIEASLDSIVQGGTGFSLGLAELLGRGGGDDETTDDRARDRPATY